MTLFHTSYDSHSKAFINTIATKHSMYIYIVNLQSFEVVFSFLRNKFQLKGCTLKPYLLVSFYRNTGECLP